MYVCVCACVGVPDLMWHLKRCDSSRFCRRGGRVSPESAPGLFTPPKCEEMDWKEGDLAQGVMRFDSLRAAFLFV